MASTGGGSQNKNGLLEIAFAFNFSTRTKISNLGRTEPEYNRRTQVQTVCKRLRYWYMCEVGTENLTSGGVWILFLVLWLIFCLL